MSNILVVEDHSGMALLLTQTLEGAKHSVTLAKDGREAIHHLRDRKFDLVLTDLKLPYRNGMDILAEAREKSPLTPVIVMTAYGTIEMAVKAVKEGAYDFLTKPFEPDHLLLLVGKALEKQRLLSENLVLREEFGKHLQFPKIVGSSPALREVVDKVQKVAPSQTTVLLLGESGTGKELFARAIHYLSPRRDGPFVAINCAAIPRDLLESELFGHEKGAFTGAIGRRLGKFELADHGTIFLDEIGDMDLGLQSKLLRVLEGDELMRVGGTSRVRIDVRVVGASNQNLQAAIGRQAFREDLYFRLSVFPITIPPLRDRREDIPALVEHFVEQFCREMKKGPRALSKNAETVVQEYPWMGNVRELQNCIERAVILSDGPTIEREHLGLRTREEGEAGIRDVPLEGKLLDVSQAASRIAESRMIRKVLRETGGNKSKAAQILQVSYKTLLTKIKEYRINSAD